MSKTNQTLEEILMEVWDCGYTIDTPDTQGMSVDQALKEIQELLLECKPDPYAKGSGVASYNYPGYNQAIDDYIKNIKELL